MALLIISRRKFAGLVGTGPIIGARAGLERVAYAAPRLYESLQFK